jgi:hypothetical protein
MAPEVESLPPIRFSLGGRLWQLCVAIGSVGATYALIFDDHLPFKDMIPVFIAADVIFIYLSLKKARVTIFDDRIEFTDFRATPEVIKFSDITNVERKQRYKAPDQIYVTTKISGREERVLLPYVYSDTFDPLKKYLRKWHDDPLDVVHALSDGAQDRDVWNTPNSKTT